MHTVYLKKKITNTGKNNNEKKYKNFSLDFIR